MSGDDLERAGQGAQGPAAARFALRGHERRLAALLGLAFFALVFALLAARTARDALLLATLGSAALLPAYAWSALAIAIGVAVASRLARRVRPEALYPIAVAAFGSLLLGARLALDLEPRPALEAPLYVAVEACSVIALVLLWRVIEATFAEARAATRMQDLAEHAIVGLLLAGSLWALLLLAVVEPRDLLIFAAGFLWVSAAAVVVLLSRARPCEHVSRGAALSGLVAAAASADLRLAAVAATVGAFTTTLVDWQVKDILASVYAGDAPAIARASAAVFAASAGIAFATRWAAPLARQRLGVMAGVGLGLVAVLLGQGLLLLLAPAAWIAVVARAPLETLRPSTLDATLGLVLRPAPRRLREHWAALVEQVLRPAGLALGALAVLALTRASVEVAIAVLVCVAALHLILRGLGLEHARSIGLSRRRWPEPGEVLRRTLGSSAAAASIQAALRDPDPADLADALEVAALIDGDLTPSIAPLLAHPDPLVRRRACDYFARRPSPQAEGPLRRALADPDVAARGSAIRAFCVVAGEAAVEVAAPLLGDDDPILVAAAAQALARIPRAAAQGRAALEQLARSPLPATRRLAAEAIRDVADPALAAATLRLLQDHDVSVRRVAVEAAGALRAPEHLRPLLLALTARETARPAEVALAGFDAGVLEGALARHAAETRVASGVLRALGRNGSAGALRALTEALWSESGVLRDVAGRALARAVSSNPGVALDRPRLRAACTLELAGAFRVLAVAEALDLPRVPRPGTSGVPPATGGATPADPRERAVALMCWALDEEFERATERIFLTLAALHPDAVGLTPEPARRAVVIDALASQLDPALSRGLLRLFSGLRREDTLRGALGMLRPPARSSTEWLLEQLGAEDPWAVVAAATWVGAHEVMEATPRILGLLDRPQALLREAALETLERLLPVEELPRVVRPLLWDESAAIRERVDRILGRIVDAAELRHASGTVERVFSC